MKIVAVCVLSTAICACGTPPTRDAPPGFFVSKASGRIPPERTELFADCLMDGFGSSHGPLTNVSARQQKRANGLVRVETLSGGYILKMSADVFPDGRVELFESRGSLPNTQGEHETFAKCLSKFGGPAK
jgi:hypothetical protein